MKKKSEYLTLVLSIIIIIALAQVVPQGSAYLQFSTSGESNVARETINKSDDQEESKLTNQIQASRNQDIPRILNCSLLPVTPDYDPLTVLDDQNNRRNSLIYNSLLEYDVETEKLTPALARQWVVYENGKHWILQLRNNVFFHDGTKFNSSVVKFNLERLLNPDDPAYGESIFDTLPLESIEIVSEDMVTINFERSYAPFVNYLPVYPIVSPTSFNESGFLVHPIGTGPYMLEATSSNETFQKLKRFYGHFRGAPPFEEVHIFAVNEVELLNDMIETDQLDFVMSGILPNTELTETWKLFHINSSNAQIIGFLNSNNQYLQNQNVRKAINYAINRTDVINTLYEGLGTPMRTLIPPGFAFRKESIPGFPFNVTYANSLLDEAGFYTGSYGYRFSLELSGPAESTTVKPGMLEALEENLKVIGIDTTIIKTNYGEYLDGEYDIFIVPFTTTENDPHIVHGYLHSEGVWNTAQYSNPQIDDYLDHGESTPIKQEREFYYNILQEFIQFDAPMLLLHHTNKQFAVNKEIEDYFTLDLLGNVVFNYSIITTSPMFSISNTGSDQVIYTDIRVFEYQNFPIPDYAIYFPDVDTVVSPHESNPVMLTIKMTYQLQNLISTENEEGKFISVQINETSPYNLRCYYNLEEIKSTTPIGDLSLHVWNEQEKKWKELDTIDYNTKFRYIEVTVRGNIIIKFVNRIYKKTFQYLPFAIILTLIAGGLVLFVTYWNVKGFQQLKEKYKL
ncbi:MAG: ABC transporter substrate-binding protein [Candidatus Kariarchaeaceae archaeon]|jgi:peptide/nickel transport system substrate-binding protein